MKFNYLLPNSFKKVGWILFTLGVVMIIINLILGDSPEFYKIKVFAIYSSQIFGEQQFFTFITNNIFDEILSVLMIIGGIFICFAKQETEDEYMSKLRLESLVWATYVNYAVLLISILFIYDLAFFYIVELNMFTVLIFFMIRFNWTLYKVKRNIAYEE